MNNLEKNIKKIEEIANKSENNNLQIDEMPKLYQEGLKLINDSEEIIKQYKKKIEEIEKQKLKIKKNNNINIKDNINKIEKINDFFLKKNEIELNSAIILYEKAFALIKETEEQLKISEKNFKPIEIKD